MAIIYSYDTTNDWGGTVTSITDPANVWGSTVTYITDSYPEQSQGIWLGATTKDTNAEYVPWA